VLLVDADLGRPSVHRRLRIAQSPGLTDAIEARKSNWGDYVHQLPGSGLHILPLGAAATGIDGLDLARLPDFLECAAGVFQWIVIDAPPMDSADGEALASMADGTVLVLRREREYFDEANAAVRRIDPARLLGAVLNFS
jgi:Mrp family chromosome partitioning ATPase